MSRSSSAYSVKIAQICFALVFLGLILFGLRSMMFGSNRNMGIILGVGVTVALVLALGGRYWLFSAFCFGFYNTMPYIRFTGAELGALVLVATFCVRQTLHLDRLQPSRKFLVWGALPFLSWMCLVWFMNPTGMFILGSSAIGGRFYFKVILSFLSMFCLSSMCFSENDCKLLGYSIAGGYLAHTLHALLFGNAEEAVFGSGTHYTFIQMSFVAPMFLCRFSLTELLVRFWPCFGAFACLGLSFYSGNRTAAARPVLVGLLASLFLKRDRGKSFVLFACALFFLFILVAGQGTAWHLPFAIQRPLSFLPGKWDRRLEKSGLNDDFRAELRYWAREHIRDRPWFGDGGFSLDLEDMVWANQLNQFQTSVSVNISGHVLARNWHNVWLGMAADFGIPLSVAWGLFMAILMMHGYQGTKRLPPGTWSQTMYLYFYLLILVEFANSFFNGGHTSMTAQQMFLWAGMMVAVLNGVSMRSLGLNTLASGQRYQSL